MIAAPPLTPRERAVLALLCEGLTQKQVAAELHISTRRIQMHVAKMKEATGATTTAAMIARLLGSA